MLGGIRQAVSGNDGQPGGPRRPRGLYLSVGAGSGESAQDLGYMGVV